MCMLSGQPEFELGVVAGVFQMTNQVITKQQLIQAGKIGFRGRECPRNMFSLVGSPIQ